MAKFVTLGTETYYQKRGTDKSIYGYQVLAGRLHDATTNITVNDERYMRLTNQYVKVSEVQGYLIANNEVMAKSGRPWGVEPKTYHINDKGEMVQDGLQLLVDQEKYDKLAEPIPRPVGAVGGAAIKGFMDASGAPGSTA
jgi:hypothetical protein